MFYEFFSLFFFFSVQYAFNLYHYFIEWRKNPQWSFSCCLALLLPLNDLQGEISGLAGTNVLKSQLDKGEFSVPNFLGTVKDSGAIDVTLEEADKEDDCTAEAHCSCQGAENRIKRSHQGTQTELFLLSISGIVVHEQTEETSVNSCEYNARMSNIQYTLSGITTNNSRYI